jgi:hypothetical protein
VKARYALLGGLAGAVALNVLHESVRQVVPQAPQVHRLGMQGLTLAVEKAGQEAPGRSALYGMALGSDLLSNGLYYSLIGLGDAAGAPTRGVVLGGVAGAGTVALPPLFGLDREPAARSAATALMTVTWYAFGGWVAGLVARWLAEE